MAGLLVALILPAAAATLAPLSAPEVWARAEFRLTGVPPAENPFDPDLIQVDVTFEAADRTRTTVPAFWFQDFRRDLREGKEVLTALGEPEWRVRFTPTLAGKYQATVAVATNRGAPHKAGELSFDATPRQGPPSRGWVKLGANVRTLATSDGRTLFVSGENVCWPQGGGTFDYDAWFEGMQRSGQNFARLWCSPWWAALEHVPGTLNNYRQEAGWQLDHIFRVAEERGLYLVLCFDHHGMYDLKSQAWGGTNNFWTRNPYSTETGGPCATPNDFFTDARAKQLYQKRLRYLIARYGSSPNLLAWQFMNEIDNVYTHLHPADVAAWHQEMARWLKQHDPFGHLVTTSLTGASDRSEIWQIPELDFTVWHSYADPAPATRLAALAQSFVTRYKKPFWVGEFGTHPGSWEMKGDPHLRGFRQGLWGGAVGGSIGTAAAWWWEDVHTSNAYRFYAHLNQVLRQAGYPDGAWRPAEFRSRGPVPVEIGAELANAEPFDALLPLGGLWRFGGGGQMAVADPLAAARASEHLNHSLRPRGPESAYVLHASLAAGAKLSIHVDAVQEQGAELRVSVDGREIARTPLPDKDGRTRPFKEYDTDFTYDLPEGRHRIEVANVGGSTIYSDHLRLTRVRPAAFAGGWQFEPEAIGVRQQDRAVVYVVAPAIAWPAGAKDDAPPVVKQQTIALKDWPAGAFQVTWHSPATGEAVGTSVAEAKDGALVLALPEFSEDLAGVVRRVD